MTAPVNMALYRLLTELGAADARAEEAARIDPSDLVTKADLAAARADLKAALLMWMITAFLAQTALLLTVFRMMRP